MKTITLTNKLFTRSLRQLLCVVALVGAFTNTAHAGYITGEIGYAGGVDSLVGGPTLGTATGLNFAPTGQVTGATGDFAAIFPLVVLPFPAEFVTLFDFNFSPALTPNPALVWKDTDSTLAFSLTSIFVETQYDSVGGSYLALYGGGEFSGGGFDLTDGNWTLTAQTATGGTLVSFSATSTVPEPGIVALFGLGLMGLGLTGTARRTRARS